MKWLEDNPELKVKYGGRSVRKKKKKNYSRRISEDDEGSVDYDGIFKLINKQTFEMVVSRFQENCPEGPKKPKGFAKHRSIFKKNAAPGFLSLQELDL